MITDDKTVHTADGIRGSDWEKDGVGFVGGNLTIRDRDGYAYAWASVDALVSELKRVHTLERRVSELTCRVGAREPNTILPQVIEELEKRAMASASVEKFEAYAAAALMIKAKVKD